MGELTSKCIRLVSTLTSHVDGLTKLLAELSNKDHEGAISSRSSLVKSLTALAEILDLMSRISHESVATDYRRQCITALVRAIELVHGMGPDDFTSAGLFLGVRNLINELSLNNPKLTRLFRSRSTGCRPF